VARDHDPELEELHKTQERLQAVIHSAPVGILEVDLEQRVIRWNPAAERIFGWSAEEILGMPVPIVPSQKQAEFEAVLATVRSGRRYPNTETFRQRKDGTLVDVEIAAAPVRDSTGEVVSHMVVFTDITNRKRQERELRASRARIVEAGDSERRRLERNLHDGAQQRLVAVALQLRLLQNRVHGDPTAEELASSAGEELQYSLQELRELARGLHPAVLEHGLEPALNALATRSTVTTTVSYAPGDRLPEPVELAAYFVACEALANVGKYAHANSARVRVWRDGRSAFIEVSDDGIGGADEHRGTGLRGLTDRVEALDGGLRVISPPGAGTTVTANMPCTSGARRVAGTSDTASSPDPSRSSFAARSPSGLAISGEITTQV
jgi:PAS domain S-box-containing protein